MKKPITRGRPAVLKRDEEWYRRELARCEAAAAYFEACSGEEVLAFAHDARTRAAALQATAPKQFRSDRSWGVYVHRARSHAVLLASGSPEPAAAKRFATRVAVGLVAQVIESTDEEIRGVLFSRAEIFCREVRTLHVGVQAGAGPAAGETVPVALPAARGADTGGKLGHQPGGVPASTGPVPLRLIRSRPLDAAIRLAREATVPRRARRRRAAVGQALVAIELATGVSLDSLLDALSPRRRA